jgi:hypothetical protein
MNERDIPADWWVAQDTAAVEQERYESAAEAMQLHGDELSKPWQWEQLELPLIDPNKLANPF